jgi:hypothetical protein
VEIAAAAPFDISLLRCAPLGARGGPRWPTPRNADQNSIFPEQVYDVVLQEFHIWLEYRTLCPKPRDVANMLCD